MIPAVRRKSLSDFGLHLAFNREFVARTPVLSGFVSRDETD